MSMENSSFISPLIRDLRPYQPGEQPLDSGFLKLNTNENPYPPSPRVIDSICDEANRNLARYPDPESEMLCATIASFYGVARGQVFVGNGSDEILAHAFNAFFRHGNARLLIPDITYGFYKVYCQLFGIPPGLVAVDPSLRISLENFAVQARADGTIAGIVIANPNAPTGEGLTLDAIRYLLAINPMRVVLVDEAYVDFGGHSAVGLVAQHPNLLIVQTLSKSRALAGLRVGFAIGQEGLISALKSVKDSFNSYPLGRLAQQGAIAAFEDLTYFEQTRKAVIATREKLARQLAGLGFDVLPSCTNFLFVRHPKHDAAWLAGQLREARILVRHFPQERIGQFLRITVGTDQQSARLLSVLAGILGGRAARR
ncbi:histidinol-phosphate aminotransferase [Kerstersia gyiorum]|uniref:Histidinol-phosphate aminotransferase n=2 Tax=Kerstersia gyiorum TaxID=206506 RepID=A0A4Q7MWX1_9BURK|nr:histidinol-phosphate transaminase [Kerstersia gyiorum]KAB0545031.1 histidinol-phosphate transaminase [Kerstersia gyiorum]RZS73551.1 histidinol-phosphate aminotransferase [Kerstersia gyiorum]